MEEKSNKCKKNYDLESQQCRLMDIFNIPRNERNFASLKKAVENSLQLNEANSRELSEKNDESRLSLEQIQKMKQEIENLNKKLSESEESATNEKEELKIFLQNLETEQNILIDLLNLPQRNFTTLKKAIENIIQNNEIFSKQVSEANAKAKLEEQKLKHEIDELKAKLNEEIQKIQQKNLEISNLNEKLTEKIRQINELEQRNSAGGQNNTQEVEDLNETITQRNQKLAIQKEKCETLEKQMQKLMDILNIAPNNRNFYNLRRELEELKQQYTIEKERAEHLATTLI